MNKDDLIKRLKSKLNTYSHIEDKRHRDLIIAQNAMVKVCIELIEPTVYTWYPEISKNLN